MRTRTTNTALPWRTANKATLSGLQVRPGYTYTGTPMGDTVAGLSASTEEGSDVRASVIVDKLRGGLNACTHTKSKLWMFDGRVRAIMRMSNEVNWNYRHQVEWSNICGYPEEVGKRGIEGAHIFGSLTSYGNLFPANWEDLYSTAALRDMLPGVRELMSLPNFIWELPEWRGINEKLVDSLRKFRDKTPRLFRKLRYASWGAAMLFLLKEFAFDPLIGDLSAIRGVASHVSAECARLRAWENKISRAHWRSVIVSASTSSVSNTLNNGWATWTRRREVAWEPCVYSATMYYRYQLGDFTKRNLPLLAAFDAFGVNFSAQTIWDAIPFSFVIDWVFRFGDFLGRYDRKNVGTHTEILGFVHSVKQKRTVTRYIAPLAPFAALEKNGEIPIAGEVKSTYIRKPYLPSLYGAGLITSSAFNLREAMLSTSLLRTRFKP